MENLTIEEYKQLISLVDMRINEIRKASYSDKAAEEEYTNLGFIKIKLDAQLKIKTELKKEGLGITGSLEELALSLNDKDENEIRGMLQGFKKNELLEIAKLANLKITGNHRKAEIITLIAKTKGYKVLNDRIMNRHKNRCESITHHLEHSS